MPSETAAPAAKQQCRLTSQSVSMAKRSGAVGQSKTRVEIGPPASASGLSHNQRMTFTFVVVGAVVLFTLVGVVSWLAGGSVYDRIGEGGLTAGPGQGGMPPGPAPGSEAERIEREQEIRQMLQARSDRLVRGGAEPLDIEAELARLSEPGQGAADAAGAAPGEPGPPGKHDAGLAEEVRQLVVARNERRARRGEQPLDVEAEVQRTLAELDPDNR